MVIIIYYYYYLVNFYIWSYSVYMNAFRETCFSLLQFMVNSYFLTCQILDFVNSEKSIYYLITQDKHPISELFSVFEIGG